MKLRILVFDDNADIRELLHTALSSKGYEVTTLSDPSEFPFLYKGDCPCSPEKPCADILIADIVMPNIDGIEFYKKLKGNGCLPLVHGNVAIMSGYLTIHYMKELNDLEIHYFRKPFQLGEIYSWVEQCRARIESANGTTAPT